MNNFQRITASPETLAAFLGSISAIETPWDDAFHRIYCSSCSAEDCDDCRRSERDNPLHTDIEKVHKEMWSAVKDRNEDAFAALSQEFERSSRILAEEWAQTSALAKIAVISESND